MKTDARVRYTKMRIREAFCECLREKPVNKITVTEICQRAEINRATFYGHYLDPFDLFEQLEQECLQGIEARLAAQSSGREGVLLAILQGIQNPSSMASLLASPNGDPGLASKITALYHKSFAPGLAKRLPNATAEQREQVYRFLAGGCGSLISLWMEGGMVTPPEELAQRVQALCNAYIDIYQVQAEEKEK